MRELKFRAWDKEDKLMYYSIELGIKFDDGSYYDFPRFLGYQEEEDYHQWEVMQFTGIKDRLGKEIFEGDIIFYPANNTKNVASMSPNVFMECFFIEIDHKIELLESKFMEVIGNIYENPELLK